MIFTYFSGGKTDVFPASAVDTSDLFAWLEARAYNAPGHEKGENGFVCFVKMKPGSDLTVAEINLSRAKEAKPPLSGAQERTVRTLGYRNYAHVEEVTAIGIDYDEFPTEQPDWSPEVWPCDVYAHSTHNFHPETAPGKWRAILPLATPMPVEREAQLRRVLQGILPRGCMVRAPHQPAFLPTCPEGLEVEIVHVEQTEIPGALDWTKLIDLDEAPTVHATGIAAGTLIGAEFERRGLVRRDCGNKIDVVCPWASEHKTGGDLAYVYYTEDGTGNFKCEHGSCKGKRNTPEAYAYFDGTTNEPVPDEGPSFSESSPLVTDSELEMSEGEGNAQPVKETRDVPWLSGADLASPVGPVNWLIPAMEIAPGRTPMIAADSGAGKSWSVQSIALSIASGLPVFGEFECRQGPVLHIAEDSDLEAVKDRYQRLARGMGLNLVDLPLAVYKRRFSMTDEKGHFRLDALKPIQMAIDKCGAVLVIVDSLATTCVGLEENAPEIAQPLYATRDPKVCWLWTHHSPKNGEGYRGSSAIRAAAGAMWGVGVEGDQRIWTSQKHAERTESQTRLSSFATTWDGQRITVVASGSPAAAGVERPADRAQLAMLRLLETGKADKATLIRAAGGSAGRNGAINRAVFDFLANPLGGQITQVERGKFILSAGVVVPKAAHELKIKVPDSLIKEINAAGRKPR